MDKKILLQNLADSLSERTGMTKRKAETFVRSFFELTEEGLLADGVVKVKGFGTTKVVKVNDRESVNINTGERFQIEGHAKVTFTPDAPFKDFVNRPFAQFTTIVLEDGVDLEELNAVGVNAEEEMLPGTTEEPIANTEEAEAAAEEPEAVEEEEAAAVEEEPAAVEEEAAAEGEEEPEAEGEEEPEAVEEEEAATVEEEEPATVEEEAATVEEEEPETVEEEAAAEGEEEPATVEEEQAPEDMQQPIIIQNTLPAPPSYNWWRIAFFTLLTVLLMVASYFAGYYRIFCPCLGDCIGEQPLPTDTICTTTPKDTLCAQKPTVATQKAEAAETTAEASAQKENTQAATAEQTQEAPAPKRPKAAEREAAKKYRQMEGGEYLITGVIETHEMAVGENLFKLAKKAYGDKSLASYIIFHNNIANPDVIQLGQSIEIPKLTHK